MNRILPGIFTLLFLLQSLFAAEIKKSETLNQVQAGRVANYVGEILKRLHFRQIPLDDKVSGMFLTNYLNALDYNHMIFLQEDVEDFVRKYGKKLDEATETGVVSPAFDIYSRYLDRLEERNILVQKLLKQEFDFTEAESFTPIRNKEPWPKDDVEAAKLWRQRIKSDLLQARLAKEKPEEAVNRISRRYQLLEKTMRDFDTGDIIQMYLTALAQAYDPHSDYMSPSEAENFDITHISLSLIGIGAQLVWEDGYTKIKELVPGGPAAKSKLLKPGDKIVAVAQGDDEPVDVVEMRLNKVVGMIRGKKGTEVKLTIIPAKNPDTKQVISIIRNEVKFQDALAQAKVHEYQGEDGKLHRLGVINLPQFYDNCAAHVETLIHNLKKEKIDGLVLDLRRNGGGILDEAVQLTGLFIKKGPVVQVKEPSRGAQVHEDKDSDVAWDGPLVVAVSKLSASASEIVAAALQDYDRAVIVGDQTTHGKGTVQQVLSLDTIIEKRQVPKPGKLKLTVSKFYRIAGGTTQKHGVTPDIVWPSLYDYLEIGEASLENCLPADGTTPAPFAALDEAREYVEELKKLSKERIDQSKDFAYLEEDIEKLKKRQEDKSVSLNEEQRVKEREKDKTEGETRKKERAARDVTADKVFELTMAMIEKGEGMQPFNPNKAKEEADLAVVEPPAGEDGEINEELEADPTYDPHLDEALHILRDYVQLIEKHRGDVVVKKD